MFESLKNEICHLTDDEFSQLPQSEILYLKIRLSALSDAELSSLRESGLFSAVGVIVKSIIEERQRKNSYREQLEEERLFRNEPVAELLALFTNKKSGKVVDARKKLQKRYLHLSYDEQLLVMRTMLKGGKTDREWCYNTLRKRWTDEITDELMAVWREYKEERCGWLITMNFSLDVVHQNIDELSYESNYYNLCKRLFSQKWFHVDKEKLRNSCKDDCKYLWMMSQSRERLTEHEALDIVYHWVAQVLCRMNPKIVIDSKYNKSNCVSYALPNWGEAYNLSMLSYRVVERMLTSMCAMGMEKAAERFIEQDRNIHYEFCRLHDIYLHNLSQADDSLVKDYGVFYAKSFPDNYKDFFKLLPQEKIRMNEEIDDEEDEDVGISRDLFEQFAAKHPYVKELMEKLDLEPIINEDSSKHDDDSNDVLPF